MDNSFSNVLIITEIKEILNKIENLIIQKNQNNLNYDEQIRKLYDDYKRISKNLSI